MPTPPLHFPSHTGIPHTNNLSDASADELLSLDHIRATLQRLEDTIVFQLIERAQFAANAPMYQPGAFPQLTEREGWHKSWTEWFLRESEKAHAKVRRWQAPDEYPFSDAQLLPAPILPPVTYPDLLYPSNKGHNINANSKIYEFYVEQVIPRICTPGSDDGQYGSAAVRDVELLSALSRRIHFGMFVSESKFRQDPAAFIAPIEAKDRVRLHKEQGPDERKQAAVEERRKIEVKEVIEIYREYVIPLTKVVEVDYLEQRLRGLTRVQIEHLRSGQPWNEVATHLKQ